MSLIIFDFSFACQVNVSFPLESHDPVKIKFLECGDFVWQLVLIRQGLGLELLSGGRNWQCQGVVF